MSPKVKAMSEILEKAEYAVVDYSDKCGSGERAEELLLCDNKGLSRGRGVRRFSQKQIIDFFKIQKCIIDKCSSTSPPLQDARKHRRRSGPLVYQKKRRRLLQFIPSEDPAQRLKQMGTLASALTTLQMEFTDNLTYFPHMAPRSANQAEHEDEGMQVLSKEDIETLEKCKAKCIRGECAPLSVIFDSCEGYFNLKRTYNALRAQCSLLNMLLYNLRCRFTVVADCRIKDMTFIAEYTGDVDFIKNREDDDCDSMMTLLLAKDPSKSLVICPDKRGNISRFINGINNHTSDGKKKQNCKCVRYSVNGECRVFLVATRDISEGERLYYDYNGYEHEYPTQHFV